ncbi:acyl-CoA thioester hydrolase [Scopulibacillus darangshiensis]|uniref:Acyl-CoA thioester hydrolase n=1 Tax=Scopulibacillus darangshiensis TaxID=442528 RepID=A0A4R2PAJ2_9BACL|nr:thioesterase family protein [Scopulibacillus darangshiensis]TCP32090.1 acyl-CoA thioester hydrolase [Scopulibacillus darangshiensis]
MQSETRLIARYSETDQMGIIHHSQYVNWFEVGRTDFIKKLGKSYNEFEKEGLWLPVIKVEVNYKSPAVYEDAVVIKTRIKEYNGIRMTFEYSVYKEENGSLVVFGTTEHCWTNKAMKPISLRKAAPNYHGQIETAYKEQ